MSAPSAPPPAGAAPARRHPALMLLRAVGTLALVAWIITVMDWGQVWTALQGADWRLLVVVLALLAIGPVLSAYKWQQLLVIHGLRFPLGTLSRWYVAAIFLSQFLPTTIGGDAYRIIKTVQGPRSRSRAVLAVVVERASGMAALAAMGYVAAVALHQRTGDPLAGAVVVVGAVGAVLGGLLAWLLLRVPVAAANRWAWAARFSAWLATIWTEFRAHPREVGRALVLSFAFHLDRIAVIWATLAALGHPPGLFELTVATTIVEVVSFLPISLGGFGVAEGSFVYVMGHFGANPEAALAGMLLIRVLLVPLHLVGACCYYAEGGRRAASEALARAS